MNLGGGLYHVLMLCILGLVTKATKVLSTWSSDLEGHRDHNELGNDCNTKVKIDLVYLGVQVVVHEI